MKRTPCLFLLLLPAWLSAQYIKPDPENEAYYQKRYTSTIPPYGLQKIQILTQKLQDSIFYKGSGLPAQEYNSLSTREKFTYHMLHQESYSQNCFMLPRIPDAQHKIAAQLPASGERYWSARQRFFMIQNRDSVLYLIKESAAAAKRIGANYKLAILEANGAELIPFIIQVYNTGEKDPDLLTVLLLLMKKNEYRLFMMSPTVQELYGPKSNYQTAVPLNPENEKIILTMAMEFFHSLS